MEVPRSKQEEAVKIICGIAILSMLSFGATLPCLCIAGDLAPFSSEAPVLIGSSTETHAPGAEPPPSESEESERTIADPLEPMNRLFFHMNDKLYFWVFKPVAAGYKTVTPQSVRMGVHNFFINLATPVRWANCLLQAKFKAARNEMIRFLLNSTLGLAGFLDPAEKELEIEKTDADFGQTLGVWGLGPAFYLHWPVIGPSSLRDTTGYGGDLFLDPRTYLFSRVPAVDMGLWSLDKVNETSLTMGEYEELKKAALDPYIAVREAYCQHRESRIKGR